MERQVIIRRVRITVSVFFGLLTVALCVLWGFSYWWHIDLLLQFIDAPDDYAKYRGSYQAAWVECGGGAMGIGLNAVTNGYSGPPTPAGFYFFPVEYDREIDEEYLLAAFDLDDISKIPWLFGISGLYLYWDNYDGTISVSFPIWLLVASAIACTGTLWFAPKCQTWIRFSLRTLLIATTLTAAVLGIGVWQAS